MRKLLIILFCIQLSACGFHLRGTAGGYQLDVESVSVSSGNAYDEITRELEAQIQAQEISIVPRSQAQYAINVLSERTSRRAVASSGDITVAEYELLMETRFEVVSQAGDALIAPTPLKVERVYRFDRSSLVGAAEEEALLTEEMRLDIAQQIMRRFAATLRKRSAEGGEPIKLESPGPNLEEHLEDFSDAELVSPE